MKLVLIQPPIDDFYETEIRLQPIGLCYLKAALKKHLPQLEVKVKDYHQGYGRYTIPLPKQLRYLRDYYPYPDKGPFSTFHHYYHFGASYAEIAEDLSRENPDIAGISSLFSPYFNEVLETARCIKEKLDIPVIVGGSHVSALARQALEEEVIDFLITGEGERPLVEFLKCMLLGEDLSAVPNLAWKKQGEPIFNKFEENYPIEELPIPDFSDFPVDRYQYRGRSLCAAVSSRGCPYHCSFCAVHRTFGACYRQRAPQDIVAELFERYRQGVKVFDFEDDNLTFSRQRTEELFQLLIERFYGTDVEFLAMNGVSHINLDEELLRLMKEAGFSELNLSLVSANPEVLAESKRPHTVEKFFEVVCAAHKLGFQVVAYQILGLPYERLDSMVETFCFCASLPVKIGTSVCYLAPGSKLAEDYAEEDKRNCIDTRLTAFAVESPHFSRDEIYTLFISSRVVNFLKEIYFEEERVSFDSLLNRSWEHDTKSRRGMQLLKRLFDAQEFCAWTTEGLKPLPKFRVPLFNSLWSRIGHIQTQEGKSIILR